MTQTDRVSLQSSGLSGCLTLWAEGATTWQLTEQITVDEHMSRPTACGESAVNETMREPVARRTR